MFILECKELSQCRKLCPHGFLPPKNGSVIQCECKPKPDGVSMRYSFFHFNFNWIKSFLDAFVNQYH